MINERRREELVNAGTLSRYAASEQCAAAVEAERRRLAIMLEDTVIASITTLLNKANKFEELARTNNDDNLTASVLADLTRNVLQRARDLQASLDPTTLETLGLEPALEALVAQTMRTSKLRVSLVIERLRERLPAQVELAIFRTAQDVLEYSACDSEPTHASLRLEVVDSDIVFTVSNAYPDTAEEGLSAAAWRVEVLGGRIETLTYPDGFEMKVIFPMRRADVLTEREMTVMTLLGEGLTNKEIAERMVVSPRTVNFHLDNIYAKLNVKTRTEAVVYAMRHNWIRRLPSAG